MTRSPVASFDISAADYDDLDGGIEAIMAAVLEWGQRLARRWRRATTR